ncbi:MAG: PKD domain-containing protein [Terriglobia bacterium]
MKCKKYGGGIPILVVASLAALWLPSAALAQTPEGAIFELTQAGELLRIITNPQFSNDLARVAVIPPRGALQGFTPGNLLVSQFVPEPPGGPGNITQVLELAPDGTFLRVLAGVGTSTPLVGANDLHFKADGTLLVTTGAGLDRVWAFRNNGASVSVFTFICCPNGIAEDAAGNVYVTSTSGAFVGIFKFNPGGGFITTIGGHSPSQGGFGGLELGPAGTLFVSQHPPNASVREFSTTGPLLRVLDSSILTFPFELAVTPTGDIFVSDARSTEPFDGIVHLAPDGSFVKTITHPSLGAPLPGLGGPPGIHLTASGTLLVTGRVLKQPPVANAGPDQTAIVGESVRFDGTGSSDPDGFIASFQWDFGDGGTADGAIVGHVFTSAGEFVVTLTVTDDDGATATDTATVTVLTVSQALQELSDLVVSFNLKQGIANSLDAKLQNALEALEAANAGLRQDASNKLMAFINGVEAQRDKELTSAQADALIGEVMRILAVL